MQLTSSTNFFIPNILLDDSRKWFLDVKDGHFIVKRLRELIDNKIHDSSNTSQETRWNKAIPRKVCIFIWRCQQKRLPVWSWLHHIGIDLNSILCPHCGNDIETLDHCFIHCPRVFNNWKKVFKWWKLGVFEVDTVDDILAHNGRNNFSKKQQFIWQAVCWTMLYLVWCARNKRAYENKVSNLTTLCDELQVVSYNWLSTRLKGSSVSWLDWCSDPISACKV